MPSFSLMYDFWIFLFFYSPEIVLLTCIPVSPAESTWSVGRSVCKTIPGFIVSSLSFNRGDLGNLLGTIFLNFMSYFLKHKRYFFFIFNYSRLLILLVSLIIPLRSGTQLRCRLLQLLHISEQLFYTLWIPASSVDTHLCKFVAAFYSQFFLF